MSATQLGKAFWQILRMTVFLTVVGPVLSASPPRSVTLVYFRGQEDSDGARLQWQTATELNTAGFRLRRATSLAGPFNDLAEIGLIPAEGSPTSGSTYEVVDATVVTGTTYWYQLVEIEYDSSEHVLETVSVLVGATPTATIESIATAEDDDAPPAPTGTIDPTTGTASATPSSTPDSGTRTPAATTTRPALASATAPPSASPTVGDSTGTGAGPADDGVAEAAQETAVLQPTPVAQATDEYPAPAATEATPAGAYPDAEEEAATPSPVETERGYPSGAPSVSTSSPPVTGFENTVGSAIEGVQAGENQAEQSGTLGRVLLWVGFVAALLIFIGGAFFSILLSTRKQRKDISEG